MEVKNGFLGTVMCLLRRGRITELERIPDEGSDTDLRNLRVDTSRRMAKVARTFLQSFGQDLLSRLRSTLIRSLGSSFDKFRENLPELIEYSEREKFRWQMPLTIPANTKFIDFYDGNTIIIIEEQPRVRLARFSEGFCEDEYTESNREGYWHRPMEGIDNEKTHFHLAFPYMVYVLEFIRGNRFPQVRVFYRNQPLSVEDDQLFLCHLPNICEESGDCEPESHNVVCSADDYEASDNLAKACSDAILDYWSSEFNTDYNENWESMRLKIGDIWQQEKKAEADPKYALEVNWEESDYTLTTLLDQIYKGWEEGRVGRKISDSYSTINDIRAEIESGVTNSINALSVKELTEGASSGKLDGFMDQFTQALFRNAQNDFRGTKRQYSNQTVRQFTTALQTAIRRTVDEMRSQGS